MSIIQRPYPVVDGGTGLSTVPTNGKLWIGNGSGVTLANLTAGSAALSIVNASGSITLDVSQANLSLSSIGGSLNLGTQVTGITHVGNGGLGISTTPTNGMIPIGSTSAGTYVAATLTPGTGISIVNAGGSITINATSVIGSATAAQVTFYTGATAVGGDAGLTYNSTTDVLTVGETGSISGTVTLNCSSTGSVSVKAPTSASGITFTLPAALPPTNTNALAMCTTAGVLGFAGGVYVDTANNVLHVGSWGGGVGSSLQVSPENSTTATHSFNGNTAAAIIGNSTIPGSIQILSGSGTIGCTLNGPLTGTIALDLPGALPGSGQVFPMVCNSSGVLSFSTLTGAGIASATISGSNLVNGTITTTQIASATITGGNIASATITGSNIAANTVALSNMSTMVTGGVLGNVSGSTATPAVVTAAQLASLIESVCYTSSSSTLTAALAANPGPFTHGLGYTPKFAWATLTCVTANDGYTSGQTITIFPSSGTGSGLTISLTSTQMTIHMGSTMVVAQGGGGVASTLTAADWSITFSCL